MKPFFSFFIEIKGTGSDFNTKLHFHGLFLSDFPIPAGENGLSVNFSIICKSIKWPLLTYISEKRKVSRRIKNPPEGGFPKRFKNGCFRWKLKGKTDAPARLYRPKYNRNFAPNSIRIML